MAQRNPTPTIEESNDYPTPVKDATAPYVPRTGLGRRLMALRQEIVQSGTPLLGWKRSRGALGMCLRSILTSNASTALQIQGEGELNYNRPLYVATPKVVCHLLVIFDVWIEHISTEYSTVVICNR